MGFTKTLNKRKFQNELFENNKNKEMNRKIHHQQNEKWLLFSIQRYGNYLEKENALISIYYQQPSFGNNLQINDS